MDLYLILTRELLVIIDLVVVLCLKPPLGCSRLTGIIQCDTLIPKRRTGSRGSMP